MEKVSVIFDDGVFDRMVRGEGSLAQYDDLLFAVKHNATENGQPAVVVSFTVLTPEGEQRRAQAVTTVKALKLAARIISAKYPDV